MGRTVAVVWHALFSIAAGVLYFFFVLPRWPELNGDTSYTLGTALRIVSGALIGLAALPVVFTLLRTRKPEYGTPQMALTVRVWSIAFHVVGGVLIVGAAVTEIWVSLDDAGRWLFGIYGAAAAIAILGIAAFYLSFLAELPPPAPRPLKIKEPKQRRRSRKDKEAEELKAGTPTEAEGEEAEKAGEAPEEEEAAAETEEKPAEVTAEDQTNEEPVTEEPATEEPEEPAAQNEDTSAADEETPAADDTLAVEAPRGGLRNRRPGGRTLPFRRRKRSRGGVAVDE